MNIIMAGIDHSLASIDIREKFSFTKTALEAAYERLLDNESVEGAVILSTCNRTEIYLSCGNGCRLNPFELLCDILEVDFDRYKTLHKLRTGDSVIRHLCSLACGMKSQIWGEDQIITQVKNAIVSAREFKSADSILEVLFRTAITAAKKVKTNVALNSRESSVVIKALDVIKEHSEIKNVLVIGNGEIGRLMTETLVQNNYNTTITLRQYRYSENIVPQNANVANYSDRYLSLNHADCVVSATLSPHHTLEYEEITKLKCYPKLFIDLAVPRDIDPKISLLTNTKLYDIDSLCSDEIAKSHIKQQMDAEVIIEKYIEDYHNWCSYKNKLIMQKVGAY